MSADGALVRRRGPWYAVTCPCGWSGPPRSSLRRVDRDLGEHRCPPPPLCGGGGG